MRKKIIVLGILATMAFSLTACESWGRFTKSLSSDMGGGLNRTVTLYDYEGDVIKSWSGKFDVTESSQETAFDINGKRVIIQGGIVVNEEN